MDAVRIGQKLKALRISKRLSGKELADILGVTPSAITQYENGSRIPSDVIKKKYSDWSKKSVSTLFYFD